MKKHGNTPRHIGHGHDQSLLIIKVVLDSVSRKQLNSLLSNQKKTYGRANHSEIIRALLTKTEDRKLRIKREMREHLAEVNRLQEEYNTYSGEDEKGLDEILVPEEETS